MIIRIILILFVSGATTFIYLAGIVRLMSALLVGFGGLVACFFGILFLVPASDRQLWLPVHAGGASWPFFLLALVLFGITVLFFTKRREYEVSQQMGSFHIQNLTGGLLCYLLSIFIPVFIWFPSESMRQRFGLQQLEYFMYFGAVLYIVGTIMALVLLYRASRGSTEQYSDFMRRVVLCFFGLFQLDKIPALIGFLLVYSPDTGVVYPYAAAMVLSAYIPIALFLLKLSWQTEAEGIEQNKDEDN